MTPCSPGAEGAIEKSWVDVDPDELLEPDLTVSDFIRAVRNGRKSVNDDDVVQHTKWTGKRSFSFVYSILIFFKFVRGIWARRLITTVLNLNIQNKNTSSSITYCINAIFGWLSYTPFSSDVLMGLWHYMH